MSAALPLLWIYFPLGPCLYWKCINSFVLLFLNSIASNSLQTKNISLMSNNVSTRMAIFMTIRSGLVQVFGAIVIMWGKYIHIHTTLLSDQTHALLLFFSNYLFSNSFKPCTVSIFMHLHEIHVVLFHSICVFHSLVVDVFLFCLNYTS